MRNSVQVQKKLATIDCMKQLLNFNRNIVEKDYQSLTLMCPPNTALPKNRQVLE